MIVVIGTDCLYSQHAQKSIAVLCSDEDLWSYKCIQSDGCATRSKKGRGGKLSLLISFPHCIQVVSVKHWIGLSGHVQIWVHRDLDPVPEDQVRSSLTNPDVVGLLIDRVGDVTVCLLSYCRIDDLGGRHDLVVQTCNIEADSVCNGSLGMAEGLCEVVRIGIVHCPSDQE